MRAHTSGHTDGYVLCAPERVVLVEAMDHETIEPPMQRNHDIALIERARDANGTRFKGRRAARTDALSSS